MNRARLVTPRPLYLLLLLLVAAARGAETMAQVEAAAVASSQTYGEYLAKLGVAGTLETYDEYLAEGGVRKTEVEEGGEEAGTAPTYDEYLASLGVVNGRMAATTAGGDEASPPQEDTSLSFALDDEAAGGGGAATTTTARASLTLQATLRDFDLARGSTQNGVKFDFEMEPLDDFLGHRLHLVDTELGADRKPRFNTSACTTTLPACGGIAIHSPYTFHKWFHDSDDSKTIAHTFTIAPVLGGVVERTASGDEVELVRYSSHSFFPIPLGAGWGDSALDGDGVRRNFGFTTEIHTKFTFLGGEIFEFEGDDDVWVYLDGKLVLDMGGVHGVVCRRVTLPAAEYTRGSMTLPLVPRDCAAWAHMAPMADEVVVDLHLTVGVTYALDMFHAERHTSASNFALTTSMRLVPDAVDARVFTAKVQNDAWLEFPTTHSSLSTDLTSSALASSSTAANAVVALPILRVGLGVYSLLRFSVDALPLFVEGATLSIYRNAGDGLSGTVEALVTDCQWDSSALESGDGLVRDGATVIGSALAASDAPAGMLALALDPAAVEHELRLRNDWAASGAVVDELELGSICILLRLAAEDAAPPAPTSLSFASASAIRASVATLRVVESRLGWEECAAQGEECACSGWIRFGYADPALGALAANGEGTWSSELRTEAGTTTSTCTSSRFTTAPDVSSDSFCQCRAEPLATAPPSGWVQFVGQDTPASEDDFELVAWAKTHTLGDLHELAVQQGYTTISLVGADAFFKTGDGAALAHTLVAAPGTTVWVDLSPPATDGAAAGTLLSSAATGTSAEETHHALSLLATNAEPTAPTPAPGLVWSSFPNHDAASGNDAFEVYGFAQSHTLKSLQQLAEEQGYGGFATVDGDAYFKSQRGDVLIANLERVPGITMHVGLPPTAGFGDDAGDDADVLAIAIDGADATTGAPTAAVTPAASTARTWERLAGYDVASGADVFSIPSWARTHTLLDLQLLCEEHPSWGGFTLYDGDCYFKEGSHAFLSGTKTADAFATSWVAGDPVATATATATATTTTTTTADSAATLQHITLVATIRDVSTVGRIAQGGRGWDFEQTDEEIVIAIQPGIVEAQLDAHGKPVFNESNCDAPLPACDGTRGVHSPTTFARWFHDSDETIPFAKELELYRQPDGMWSFGSAAFFPLDHIGYGNEGFAHNHAFTTELHTTFIFSGDEVFNFYGDDDLWVFINGERAIDLGGVHASACRKIDLSQLLRPSPAAAGAESSATLTPRDCHDPAMPPVADEASVLSMLDAGATYTLDIFHAERKTDHSKFFITTSLDLADAAAAPYPAGSTEHPAGIVPPVIAVYAHRAKHAPALHTIARSTVKWLHNGGAAAVVLTSSMSHAAIREVIRGSNALLIPGGTWAWATPEWDATMAFILDEVALANGNGTPDLDGEAGGATSEEGGEKYYPVWALCTGFEFMLNATGGASATTPVLSTHYDAINVDTPLDFVQPAADNSALFATTFADASLKSALAAEPSAFANKHWLGISPASFAANEALSSEFEMLSTSVDRNGRAFVSTIEGKSWPFYGTQWHPEITPEEDFGLVAVTEESALAAGVARSVGMKLATFFVDEARRNSHSFASPEQRASHLVYQYPIVEDFAPGGVNFHADFADAYVISTPDESG